jgi:hypothetical protein
MAEGPGDKDAADSRRGYVRVVSEQLSRTGFGRPSATGARARDRQQGRSRLSPRGPVRQAPASHGGVGVVLRLGGEKGRHGGTVACRSGLMLNHAT